MKTKTKIEDGAVKLNEGVARRVLEVVDAGLVMGMGQEATPGAMCVEAAVNFALGLPHGDNPPCVGAAVREFKIRLNDCPWSSGRARARGMRRMAVAQLGSNEINQEAFKELLVFKGGTKVLPWFLRKYAGRYEKELGAVDHGKVLDLAKQFEAAKSPEAMKKIIEANKGFEVGVGVGFEVGVGVGFGFGFGFGVGFEFGFGVGFEVGVGFGFGFGDEKIKEFFGDEFLLACAGIGEECLVELKSPGCEWLPLCDVATGKV